jgi:hypothetical protein
MREHDAPETEYRSVSGQLVDKDADIDLVVGPVLEILQRIK